ncbi:MAG: hypothetical protein ACRCYQ_06925 [Nocardioides sp.]
MCHSLLAEAEGRLGGGADDGRSPWISGFDQGSPASEATRCMQQLGDLGEAERRARQVVALRPRERVRSRAFGQLQLAATLTERGQLDEACEIGQEVIASTQSLGSYLVTQRLHHLQRLLEPHRGAQTVNELLARLEDSLRERMVLLRCITQSGPPGAFWPEVAS